MPHPTLKEQQAYNLALVLAAGAAGPPDDEADVVDAEPVCETGA